MGKKVKTILISQPKPATEKSPYFDLADKHKLKIDFRSFIHVEGVDGQTFREGASTWGSTRASSSRLGMRSTTTSGWRRNCGSTCRTA